MKDITIGITINIKKDENIWNNGIVQNVINFALVLKNSQNNYNVLILNTSEFNELGYKINEVNIYPIKDKLKELDIIFILGSQIYDSDYNYLKNKGCKILYYSCGTNYILDMEAILFNDNTDKKLYKHIPDEVWMIPQNMNVNKYYFETIYRKNVKAVPFIWSPFFIDYVINENKIKGKYTPSDEPKRIACFEPNIDIVKFCMYDILVVEQAYRERPDLIKHFYVTNAMKIKSNPLFVDIMNQLDVVKNGVATFESRFRIPYFLDTYTDIVVAHQWENPLNYAYLEPLYLGYPLIHNASMIKDGGYYYNEFDVDKGKTQLLYALTEHDKHIEEYNEKNKKVLKRYLPTNNKSIEIYDKMIDDLFDKKSIVKKSNFLIDSAYPHLGGSIEGGDDGTWSPEIWDFLIDDLSIKSMIDVGCAEGLTVKYFKDKNIDALGIEGLQEAIDRSEVKNSIIRHDYTQGKVNIDKNYDLCWSCEFVEHVEEQYVDNFMDTFKKCKYVVMTYAFPGQVGYHHVNCRHHEYWINLLERNNFKYNHDYSMTLRSITNEKSIHARSSLLFFKSKSII